MGTRLRVWGTLGPPYCPNNPNAGKPGRNHTACMVRCHWHTAIPTSFQNATYFQFPKKKKY